MAPSVAEIPTKQDTASVTVPGKSALDLNESKPKVRRVIDEEENTTASVSSVNVYML